MKKLFVIKGLSPFGCVVDLELVAASETDAKLRAEEAGLRFVTTRPSADQVIDARPDIAPGPAEGELFHESPS